MMTEIARVQGALDSVGERARSLQTVYVYQAPVRLWHWVSALLHRGAVHHRLFHRLAAAVGAGRGLRPAS